MTYEFFLKITIKTHRNNAGEAKDLGQKEGGIGHEDEEGALKKWVLPDVGDLVLVLV